MGRSYTTSYYHDKWFIIIKSLPLPVVQLLEYVIESAHID